MGIQAKIRILLVDDHRLFRDSLRLLLQDHAHLQVAATCGTTAEARAIIERDPVDLILLDDEPGGQDELDLPQFVSRYAGLAKVLIVTTGLSAFATRRLLANGCRGIIHKHNSSAELVGAIYRVMGGEVWLDSRTTRVMVNAHLSPDRFREGLTEREAAVLQGVFDGFKNKEIAAALRSSESSVKAVIQDLFDKIGVRTRGQLVQAAIKLQRRHESPAAMSLYT